MIKIDKGVPLAIRVRPGNYKYPWLDMVVGDSFFVAGGVPANLHGPSKAAAKKMGSGCKFKVSTVIENGVRGTRAWRVS